MAQRSKYVSPLSDGLDNERFDQPLTLIFTLPPEWVGQPVHITQNERHIDWIFPRNRDHHIFCSAERGAVHPQT